VQPDESLGETIINALWESKAILASGSYVIHTVALARCCARHRELGNRLNGFRSGILWLVTWLKPGVNEKDLSEMRSLSAVATLPVP
jgi:hypothetical protein